MSIFPIVQSGKEVTAKGLAAGSILDNNKEPIEAIVRSYDKSNGNLLYETKSKPNGYYYIFVKKFSDNYIIAIDPTNQYQAVIQDNVKPK